jgi:DNA repair exonuclease SbcCD ATPase subunit
MKEKQIKIENLRFLKELLPELNIEVESPCGYSKILAYDITAKDSEYWAIETKSGKRLGGSKDHLIKNDLGQFIKLENLINNISKINIQTKDGIEKIKCISLDRSKKEDLVDIQVEGVGQYYANNIVVHNSNILNSVTYGLYGTTFDTLKKEKNRDNKFINSNNQKDYSEVQLIVEINGEDYAIRRRTERKWNKTHNEITSCSTKTYFNRLDSNNEIIDENNLSEQDKVNTQRLIEQSIGDFDEFITKSLINADTLNDILTTDHAKFLDSILRDTGLDIFEKKLNVFKDYKKNEYKKESLLNISVDKYNQLIEYAKTIIEDNKTNIEDRKNKIEVLNERISNGEIHVENTIKTLKQIDYQLTNLNIVDVKNEINKLINDKEEKKRSQKDLLKQIEELNKFVLDEELYNSLKDKSNSFNDWLISKNTQIKDLNKEINDITNDIASLNGKIYKERMSLSKIDSQIDNDRISLQRQIELIEREISLLEDSKVCPSCNRLKDDEAILSIKLKVDKFKEEIQKIQDDIKNEVFKYKYQSDLTVINQLIINLEQEIKVKELIIESKKVSIRDFEDEVNNESVSITKVKEKIAKIEIIIKEIEKRNKFKQEYDNIPMFIENIELKISQKNDILSKYDINIVYVEENKKIQSKIDTYKSKVQEFKEEKESYVKEVNQFNFNIDFAKNEIKNYNDTIEKYLKQQRQELIREEYQNCIHREGIPTSLLKKLIPKVNMYLQGYTEDIDFNVFFDNDLIYQMSKKDTPEIIQNVISGSGMERVFACICLRLALRFMNNRSRPSILLLDELFGKLSERNAINFINLMTKVKQDIDKILIIEHAYGDIINPDYLIMVDKDENGNSFIELQN